ncbi:MAG: DUF1080 domain-containing protein [Acidobacteria bacterium]|nr:DUF1080 domain-containing protein [Acidobacteriota bacterium]
MKIFPLLLLPAALLFAAGAPKGFRSIFNGKDLKGWHISEVNHHGNTKAWKVEPGGILTVTQDRPGNGGILLTDKLYKNFEVSLEVNPDFGCDGGLFLRSTEKGEAYQVMLDYLEGGNMGGIYGEGLKGLGRDTGTGKRMDPNWKQYWKKGDWNLIRARIEGDVPHIQVWMNGTQIVDWTDSENRLPGGATSGMIAVQSHMSNPDPAAKGNRWVPNGFHRFRNIAVREIIK